MHLKRVFPTSIILLMNINYSLIFSNLLDNFGRRFKDPAGSKKGKTYLNDTCIS